MKFPQCKTLFQRLLPCFLATFYMPVQRLSSAFDEHNILVVEILIKDYNITVFPMCRLAQAYGTLKIAKILKNQNFRMKFPRCKILFQRLRPCFLAMFYMPMQRLSSAFDENNILIVEILVKDYDITVLPTCRSATQPRLTES